MKKWFTVLLMIALTGVALSCDFILEQTFRTNFKQTTI